MNIIRTERLLLRRATTADLRAIHRLLSNPIAMRYWSSLPHTDLAQSEHWITSMIEAPPEQSDDFLITLDAEVVGKLGCWRLPEIGFLLDPVLWGQGYAGEAMEAFIDRRRRLGSSELTADVDPRNARSLALLRRFGFEETGRANGTWLVGGETCDSVYMRLTL